MQSLALVYSLARQHTRLGEWDLIGCTIRAAISRPCCLPTGGHYEPLPLLYRARYINLSPSAQFP